jgi:uncharacterized protein (DUF2126 family)
VLPLRHAGEPALTGALADRALVLPRRAHVPDPGDSPMGYRLPLDSLPWVSAGDYPYLIEQDPFAPRGRAAAAALRGRRWASRRRPDAWPARRTAAVGGLGGVGGSHALGAGQAPQRFQTRRRHPHRAVRQARDPRRANGPAAEAAPTAGHGVLYIFMPPLEAGGLPGAADRHRGHGEELAASGAGRLPAAARPAPEAASGHARPRRDRGQHPPGQQLGRTGAAPVPLRRGARLARLSTEKFMLDGRHTGTGGGNHFVLGGATPADSPFLRRPTLLASLLAYWHNHPSLSYLFSACSSARPARPRASTRRATTSCAS